MKILCEKCIHKNVCRNLDVSYRLLIKQLENFGCNDYEENTKNKIANELNSIDVEVNITEEFEPQLPYIEYTEG